MLKLQIPFTAKPTYYRHLRYSILHALASAFTLGICRYVAAKELDASIYHLGAMELAPFLGMILLPFSPSIIRGPNKLKTLRVIILGTALPVLFLGWVTDPTWFTALVCLALFIQAMGLPAFSGILQSNYPREHRNKLLSAVFTRSMIVGVIARIATGQLLNWDPGCFAWLTPLGAFCWVLGLQQLMRIRVRDESKWKMNQNKDVPQNLFTWAKGEEILKKDRAFLWYERVFAYGALVNQIGGPLYILYLTQTLDANWQEITMLSALEPFIGWLSIPIWGRLFDSRESPFWQRGILNGFWAILPLGYAISAMGVGRMGPLLFAAGGHGIADKGSALNWTLGAVHFAPKEGAVAYNSIHTVYCGIRGLTGALVGMLLYRVFGSEIPEENHMFFSIVFFALAAIVLSASVCMMYLHQKFGSRFQDQH